MGWEIFSIVIANKIKETKKLDSIQKCNVAKPFTPLCLIWGGYSTYPPQSETCDTFVAYVHGETRDQSDPEDKRIFVQVAILGLFSRISILDFMLGTCVKYS